MQDKIWRFSVIFFLVSCTVSCGPKPSADRWSETPETAIADYGNQYRHVRAAICKYEVVVSSPGYNKFLLTIAYIAPDSFAFLVEGFMNMDIIRGALCGDSGFWELPRKGEFAAISKFDKIDFADFSFDLTFESFAHAIFFFIGSDSLELYKHSKDELMLTTSREQNQRFFNFDRRKGRLFNQKIVGLDSLTISYDKWRNIDDTPMPGRVTVCSSLNETLAKLFLKKAHFNRPIPKSMFLLRNR